MYGIFFAVIPVVLLLLYFIKKKPVRNLPPGPDHKFLLGNFSDLDKERVHQSLHKMAKQHGHVMYLKLLQKQVIVLSSAEMLRKGFASKEYKTVLNDKPKGFYGTYILWDHQDVLLGPYCDVTFKMKQVMRRGLQPCMTSEKVTEETKLLCELINDTDGKDFCPQDIIEKVYSKAMSSIICGFSLPGDRDLLWDFLDWSNELLSPSVEIVLKNLPFLRHFPGQQGQLYKTVLEKRDRLLKRYVDDCKESYSADNIRGLVDTCFQIQTTETAAGRTPWLKDEMIRTMVLDTIGAGLVATVHSVVAAILNLLYHPDVVEKMQKEIKAVLTSDEWITGSDVTKLPYCHAVIFESTRLSTVVPIVSHLSSEDTEFEGYFIPKGSIVWGNFWTAHHDEKLWEEPMKFKPNRFLDENGAILPPDHIRRQSLTPYGLGPRYCVGDDYAKMRIFVHAVSIVQKFDIFPPKDSDLISNDPNLYTSGAVLQVQKYQCRAISRVT